MHRLRTLLTVIGAVTVLVLAGNTIALAATGGKFFLGQTNKANKQSTLKRTTSGSALGLVTKSSANAPLATNGRGKVGNLNADLIDGKDSTAFAPASLAAYAPFAMGFVDPSGGLTRGRGVAATAWNGVSNRYEITLTGTDFYFAEYAPTVLTSSCSDVTVRYGSLGTGKMVVYFKTLAGDPTQCGFAFTVHRLPL